MNESINYAKPTLGTGFPSTRRTGCRKFPHGRAADPSPAEGQVLLRTVWLSLDPYMRGRMSDAPSYSPPVEIGAVMVGGTVSRVETSRHPDYKEGEWVLGYSGWQEYELSDGKGLVRLGENPSHPSWALGVLGMPGFTAYMGLLDIGQPQAGKRLSWRQPRAGRRNGGADR